MLRLANLGRSPERRTLIIKWTASGVLPFDLAIFICRLNEPRLLLFALVPLVGIGLMWTPNLVWIASKSVNRSL